MPLIKGMITFNEQPNKIGMIIPQTLTLPSPSQLWQIVALALFCLPQRLYQMYLSHVFRSPISQLERSSVVCYFVTAISNHVLWHLYQKKSFKSSTFTDGQVIQGHIYTNHSQDWTGLVIEVTNPRSTPLQYQPFCWDIFCLMFMLIIF